MIDGLCFTNIDKFRSEKWPTKFVAVPRVGELVESESGKVLKVVAITHRVRTGPYSDEAHAYVKIELHLGVGADTIGGLLSHGSVADLG